MPAMTFCPIPHTQRENVWLGVGVVVGGLAVGLASRLLASESGSTKAPPAKAVPSKQSSSGTVGFVGLGIMGDGMARRLLGSGRKLVVYNRSAAKSEALKAEFPDAVTVAASAAAAVSACELTYVMLSTPEACRAVYEAKDGILAGVAAGKCIVDCATLAVADMERMAKQVTAKAGRFLEAPVSGSKVPAAQGQLIFLCGGDEPLFNEVVGSDLAAMGKASFFFGRVGSGTRMKLVVNMVMGSMQTASRLAQL